MVKKLCVMLACLALVPVVLAGCSGGGSSSSSSSSSSAGQTAQTTVNKETEQFVGCWEYEDYYSWVCINDDGTFELYTLETGRYDTGKYEVADDTLTLDGYNASFTPDGDGGLIDHEGDTLFASSLPNFDATADDFVGVWKYEDYDIWIVVYDDETYEVYTDAGDPQASGTLTVESGLLELEDVGAYVLNADGDGLLDSEGDALSASTLPTA